MEHYRPRPHLPLYVLYWFAIENTVANPTIYTTLRLRTEVN